MRVKPFFKKLIIATILTVSIGFPYAYYEGRNIKLRKYEFKDNKIPKGFHQSKFVFISDIHCNYFFDGNDLKDLVTQINQLEPDFVLIGGDLLDNNLSYLEEFSSGIKNINSPLGSYFVLGNHDHWNNARLTSAQLVEAGLYPCDNQSYWLKQNGDSIKLGGVGDLWEDAQIPENTTYDLDSSKFCILLSHNPDYMEQLNQSSHVDLMLSGHNHGGQVTFFGLYAPILPSMMHDKEMARTGQKYRYGWKRDKEIDLYISSGIGLGVFPFRFFAPPEIVEITLVSE